MNVAEHVQCNMPVPEGDPLSVIRAEDSGQPHSSNSTLLAQLSARKTGRPDWWSQPSQLLSTSADFAH